MVLQIFIHQSKWCKHCISFVAHSRSLGFGLGLGTSDCSCSLLIVWMVLRPFWSSASMDCSRGDLPCKTLQVHGQQVILTWPVSQSMSGLWCFNHVYLRIIWCLPRSVISATTFSRWPWKSMTISALWVMSPAELRVPSTLYTGMGFGSGSNSIFLICAHFQSMNTVLAPLLRRASILLKQQFCLTGAMLSFNTMSLRVLQFSMRLGGSGVSIGVGV